VANSIERAIPTAWNEDTREVVHPSVLRQKNLSPQLRNTLLQHHNLIAKMRPLEEEMEQNWPYKQGQPAPAARSRSKSPKPQETTEKDDSRDPVSKTKEKVEQEAAYNGRLSDDPGLASFWAALFHEK
jgi:uncharacterized membrane protein (UPF0182 family)